MAIETLSSRILDIAEDELPKRSLGLQVLGIDVCWGNWNIQTPQGRGIATTYALLVAVRATGSRGEVLLGNQPPVVNVHAFSGTCPSEIEIRQGVSTSCDALRQHMQRAQSEQNGHGIPQAGPSMPIPGTDQQ